MQHNTDISSLQKSEVFKGQVIFLILGEKTKVERARALSQFHGFPRV